MNLTRCENGHFYDADRFTSCPHCNGAGASTPSAAPSDGFAEATGTGEAILDSTSPFAGFQDSAFETPTAAYTMPAQPVQPAAQPVAQVVPPVAPVQQGGLGSLVQEVHQANSPQVAPAPMEEEEDKTQRYQAVDSKIDPVVGWLVAVSGSELGKSYILKSGKNFIGRSDKMDVVIKGDQSISRDKHAILLYDPKSRMFLVQPGESHELFYLNDELVLNPKQMNAMDKLQLGSTTLLFVPFCGTGFAWEDIENDK